MQPHTTVNLRHTTPLLLIVSIKMRLHTHHTIPLIHLKSPHPRMISTRHINHIITQPQTDHQRRNQHITRTRHATPTPPGPTLKPTPPLHSKKIEPLHPHTPIALIGRSIHTPRHKQPHIPVHTTQSLTQPQHITIIRSTEKHRISQHIKPRTQIKKLHSPPRKIHRQQITSTQTTPAPIKQPTQRRTIAQHHKLATTAPPATATHPITPTRPRQQLHHTHQRLNTTHQPVSHTLRHTPSILHIHF